MVWFNGNRCKPKMFKVELILHWYNYPTEQEAVAATPSVGTALTLFILKCLVYVWLWVCLLSSASSSDQPNPNRIITITMNCLRKAIKKHSFGDSSAKLFRQIYHSGQWKTLLAWRIGFSNSLLNSRKKRFYRNANFRKIVLYLKIVLNYMQIFLSQRDAMRLVSPIFPFFSSTSLISIDTMCEFSLDQGITQVATDFKWQISRSLCNLN